MTSIFSSLLAFLAALVIFIDYFIHFLIVVRVNRVRKLLELQSKLVNTLLIWFLGVPFIKTRTLLPFESLFNEKLHNVCLFCVFPQTVTLSMLLVIVRFGIISKHQLKWGCQVQVCLVCLSTGKAAVPSAPPVTLQSVLPRTCDSLRSITNEGLCLDFAVDARSAVWILWPSSITLSVFWFLTEWV